MVNADQKYNDARVSVMNLIGMPDTNDSGAIGVRVYCPYAESIACST